MSEPLTLLPPKTTTTGKFVSKAGAGYIQALKLPYTMSPRFVVVGISSSSGLVCSSVGFWPRGNELSSSCLDLVDIDSNTNGRMVVVDVSVCLSVRLLKVLNGVDVIDMKLLVTGWCRM